MCIPKELRWWGRGILQDVRGTVPCVTHLIHLDPPDLSQESEMESQRPGQIPRSLLHLLICWYLWAILFALLPTEATLKNPLAHGAVKGWTRDWKGGCFMVFHLMSTKLFPHPLFLCSPHPHTCTAKSSVLSFRLLHLWWPCVVGRGWVESVSTVTLTETWPEFSKAFL